MLHPFKCCNGQLRRRPLLFRQELHVTHNVVTLIYSLTKSETQKHLHVASESVQVVVGLLTFNNAFVFQRVKVTILQHTTNCST